MDGEMNGGPARGSLIGRVMGTLMFRTDAFEEIESDTTAMGQAFAIVLIVTVCAIIGGILNEVMSPPSVELQLVTGETVSGELVTGEPVIGGTGGVERLNTETLEDETVTGQIVAVETLTLAGIVLAIVGGLFFGVVFWAFWVTLLLMVGGGLLRSATTHTSWSELGRVVGFAYAPRALYLFSFIPGIGWLFVLIAFLWTLAGVIVAVRHALDYDSVGRAILVVLITGVIGAIPWIIIKVVEWMITG